MHEDSPIAYPATPGRYGTAEPTVSDDSVMTVLAQTYSTLLTALERLDGIQGMGQSTATATAPMSANIVNVAMDSRSLAYQLSERIASLGNRLGGMVS